MWRGSRGGWQVREWIPKGRRDALFKGVIKLAAITYAALKWGAKWKDKLVVAITDSENAIGWIRKGFARNGYTAYLLGTLARLQLRHGFRVWAKPIASKDNQLSYCASRTWKESGDDVMETRR